MKKKDLFLALLVVTIWGSTFTVIKLGLLGMPPMMLVAFRFTLAAIPAVFFIKKPNISWKYIVAYGMTAYFGQFACDIYSLYLGMPAGIASVIMQSNVFFIFIFSAILLKEKIKAREIIGLVVAIIGIILLSVNVGIEDIKSIPTITIVLELLAAVFWAASSIVVRFAVRTSRQQNIKLDVFGLVVWGSLVPIIPFFLLGILIESPMGFYRALVNLNIGDMLVVIFLAFIATLFCFSAWSRLLRSYNAGKVAMLTLLVPVSGLIIAWLVMGEVLTSVQIIGAAIVILGLIISNFGITNFKWNR
ncbi:MAG: EamA family transporter [Firmicutes bacterium]|nr:EamA family transporter [Bacillota bacterium]